MVVKILLAEYRSRLRLVARDRRQLREHLLNLFQQGVNVIADRRHDREEIIALRVDVLFERFDLLVARHVALVARDNHRTLCKLGIELLQLRIDRLEVLDRISALAARDVDDMDEHAAALDVAQELMSQTRSLPRALDQSGDIRHDKAAALAHRNNTENGRDGGEVIVADLGLCLRDDRDQRALADVREADQSDVRQKLQLEHDVEFLTGQTGLRETRHLTDGRREMRIAPAALAASRDDMRLAVGDVREDAVAAFLPDESSQRHADDQILRVLAAAASSPAVFSARRGVFSFVAEIGKRAEVGVGKKNDVAASAAVAAVGTACRDILLAVKRHRSVAAVARFDFDVRFIYKHICSSLYKKGG